MKNYKEPGFPGNEIFKTWEIPTYYLLSIDLEDIRTQTKDGPSTPCRLPEVMEQFLSFLNEQKIKITFFVVGEVAKEFPSMIKEIISCGHEIGCHSYSHSQLDSLTPEKFREDVVKNVEVLKELGAEEIAGFRAPDFSLVETTQWVWDVLKELEFKYSSSVLPARNPMYGWQGFDQVPVKLSNGLWELPISIAKVPGIKIPFVGGVYLRALPKPVILYLSKKYAERSFPLVGYIHPYDIDRDQVKFKIENNAFFNWLVYYNRKSTLSKLASLLRKYPSFRCIDYIRLLDHKSEKDI